MFQEKTFFKALAMTSIWVASDKKFSLSLCFCLFLINLCKKKNVMKKVIYIIKNEIKKLQLQAG